MIPFSKNIKRILITGGSGFIGGMLVRKLLKETSIKIYNLDKLGYASNLNCFDEYNDSNRYELLNVDLFSEVNTKKAIKISNPDLVFHLAAESHVDNSILGPSKFLESNIIGTFNLLEALLSHWQLMPESRKENFRMLHVSTDEVFGSTNDENISFSEQTPYNPRSPYSATKAASDHLVRSWNNTYGLPTIITHSCNNFGPWQFPEKLIPVIISNAISNQSIPLYGTGKNVREWIYVEDHIDALIKVILKGKLANSYCIGSGNVKTNEEVVEIVCDLLDVYNKQNSPHIRFKKYVRDRQGHDQGYELDSTKINSELNWFPKFNFKEGMYLTIKWYLENLDWLNRSN